MSYLREVLAPRPVQAHSGRDPGFWTTAEGYAIASSGVNANPEAAMGLRAVYRCVALLSGVVAYLPLIIYRRLGDRGKERAENHPLHRMFQLGPNRWQTAEQWIRLVVAHLELRGNSYNEIIAGPRGIIDQLIPLHPARVTPEVNNRDGLGWVDARHATLKAEGVMRYKVREGGQERVLTEDDVFHIRGLSSNGVLGLSRIALMRETVGLALATEGYGSRFFSQNASPRGVYKVPGKLSPEGFDRLKAQVDAETGMAHAHRTKILEQGTEWQAVGLSNEDSQFLETRKFQVAEIAGWFGVPPHLIGDVERSTSWGSGLAEQNLALLTYTVAPILECIEQAIDKELILADRTYFAEFLVDALLRTDPKARAEALALKRQNGIINANEWRRLDNENPIEGPGGEAYLVNGNMVPVTRALEPPPPPPAFGGAPGGDPPDDEDEDPPVPAPPRNAPEASRAALIVRATAAQLVRREVRWVTTWAPRLARDGEAWQAKVGAFYDKHRAVVSERLHLSDADAEGYCDGHERDLLAGNLSAVETWEKDAAPRLVALAIGG